MKIGIVGAGFAGLAAAVWAVRLGCEVTVFDAVGVGGGASGIASGLLHPYPGKDLKKSKKADEAMEASLELVGLAEKVLDCGVAKRGLVRRAIDEKQRELFQKRAEEHEDLEWDGELKILSGWTIDVDLYLKGLWQFCEGKGARLVKKKVGDVPKGYDAVILAAGYGMRDFGGLELKWNKGQLLECVSKEKASVIGDGYLAVGKRCFLGSSYEHGFTSTEPDLEKAKELILPRAKKYLAEVEVLGVRSGVRVSKKGDYYPVAKEVEKGVYALTGFGSRGLLYHALLAKELIAQVSSTG